jgi:hypothetical protein
MSRNNREVELLEQKIVECHNLFDNLLQISVSGRGSDSIHTSISIRTYMDMDIWKSLVWIHIHILSIQILTSPITAFLAQCWSWTYAFLQELLYNLKW